MSLDGVTESPEKWTGPLLVMPVVVGRGKRMFTGEGVPFALTLAQSTALNNGVLYLTYAPATTWRRAPIKIGGWGMLHIREHPPSPYPVSSGPTLLTVQRWRREPEPRR
jgi:hypothetical protein